MSPAVPAAPTEEMAGGPGCIPRELRKTVLPPYVIEPPDVLAIEAMHAVPKQPYHLQPFDMVAIQVGGTPPEAPINGVVPIGADGQVALGPHYGSVFLAGKTVDEAKEAISKQLANVLVKPEVTVSLTQSAAEQKIFGPHLVAMDGTVTLGSYGSVSVIGLTVGQARQAVQRHLLEFFQSVDVSLEVSGYNSKSYYIVTQGAGLGDGVYRFPCDRQRDGAGRHIANQRLPADFFAEDLDRPAYRPPGHRATIGRQLGGYRGQRQCPLELPDPSRRPHLRCRGQAHRPRHGAGQALGPDAKGNGVLDIRCGHRHEVLGPCAQGRRQCQCDFLAGTNRLILTTG